MTYALTSDGFYVCISLTNIASSRRAQTATNTTMNVMYFGNQNVSIAGTLTNNFNKVQASSSAGMIAGAVIGSVLGCCLLVVVAGFMIFAITWTRRIVNVKNPQRSSFEMLNSPAKLQSGQEPAIINDVEQPDTPVDEQESIEQGNMNPFDDQVVTTETVPQANNRESSIPEDEQAVVPEDTSVIDNITAKPEISTGEILLNLSDDHVETISQSMSSDNVAEDITK
jgi:hypothetical protein